MSRSQAKLLLGGLEYAHSTFPSAYAMQQHERSCLDPTRMSPWPPHFTRPRPRPGPTASSSSTQFEALLWKAGEAKPLGSPGYEIMCWGSWAWHGSKNVRLFHYGVSIPVFHAPNRLGCKGRGGGGPELSYFSFFHPLFYYYLWVSGMRRDGVLARGK